MEKRIIETDVTEEDRRIEGGCAPRLWMIISARRRPRKI